MTNPVKGEVTFDAHGKTYTFKLGTNAQVMLESKTGVPMAKWFGEKEKESFSITDFRMLFHAGLYRQHPGITEDDVGDLIDEIGPAKVGEVFRQAAEYAKATNESLLSNKPATNGAAPDEPRPTKAAKAPIGMNS